MKNLDKKVAEALVEDIINELILQDSSKDLVKTIVEVAVQKHGDSCKSLKGIAEAVYKERQDSEKFAKTREEVELKYDIVDKLKG